jgi:hypothetical protein
MDFSASACCAQDPDSRLLHFPKGPGKVGNRNIGNSICRAARNLDGRCVQTHRFVLGGNDRMGTRSIRHPETGPQVMGILNAIEHQQQGRFGQTIENIG